MKQYLKLTIPEPCHEDWIKMTTTEKGAFCKVCTKEVVDFSTMSQQEVKDFFIAKAKSETEGKTCGRFKPKQLNSPMAIDNSLPVKTYSFYQLQKFAAALLIVFGTTLMSCNTSMGQITGEVEVGKVMIEHVVVDTIQSPVLNIDSFDIMMGDIDVDIDLTPIIKGSSSTPQNNDDTLTEEGLLVEHIELVEISTTGLVSEEKITKKTPTCNTKPLLDEEAMRNLPVLGGLSVIYIDADEIEEEEVAIDFPRDDVPETAVSVAVFPNPAKDEVTIIFEVNEEKTVKFYLFDALGNTIESKVWRGLVTGKQQRKIDVSNLIDGVYVYKLQIGTEEASGKINVAN
jgi:hypothetical protein